jgi:NADH-quinone oxidoreductase subunit C
VTIHAQDIVGLLQAASPGAPSEVAASTDQPTIYVPATHIVEIARELRDRPELAFNLLADLTAVDLWPREPRYEVVYHFVSLQNRLRLRVKTRVDAEPAQIATVSGVWAAAAWLEREVWDMFGIVFLDHPDLRRLLMPDDWEGHPLRKDYPVQIRMAAKTFAPLQLSEAEFRANLEADRVSRRGE